MRSSENVEIHVICVIVIIVFFICILIFFIVFFVWSLQEVFLVDLRQAEHVQDLQRFLEVAIQIKFKGLVWNYVGVCFLAFNVGNVFLYV